MTYTGDPTVEVQYRRGTSLTCRCCGRTFEGEAAFEKHLKVR